MLCSKHVVLSFVVLAACVVLPACSHDSSSPARDAALARDSSVDGIDASEDGDATLRDAGSKTQEDASQTDSCVVPEASERACGLNGRGRLWFECVGSELTEQCDDSDQCKDGDTRAGVQVCGLDNSGYLIEECVQGQFVTGSACSSLDECKNGDERTSETACGQNNAGRKQERCTAGLWIVSETCLEPALCTAGARQPGTTACGLNGRGAYEQECVSNHWLDSMTCRDIDTCVDASSRAGKTPCGHNQRGALREVCVQGSWRDSTACVEGDQCTDGSVRVRASACGVNNRGAATDTCVAGQFVFSACADPDVCRDAEEQTGATACGENGRGRLQQECRTGKWIDTQDCLDADVCMDGTVRSRPNSCGINGRGTRTERCVQGQFRDQGTCTDADVCVDNTSESVACTDIPRGVRERTCKGGQWSEGTCGCPTGEHLTCAGTCALKPEIVHVRADSSAPCQDGRSFATAFAKLEDGLAVTRLSGEVWVTGGAYVHASKSVFRLPAGARLLGGFTGSETLATQRDPKKNVTTLTGSQGARTLAVSAARGTPALIDGIAFRDAKSGAVHIQGDAEVRDCTFANNRSPTLLGGTLLAGAVDVINGSVRIARTVFDSNFGVEGGAVHGIAADITVVDSTFTSNRATLGGALSVNGNLVVLRSAFSRNAATQRGGAVYSSSALTNKISIYQSFFEKNVGLAAGGAIDTTAPNVLLVNSVFVGNLCGNADCVGGAISLEARGRARLEHVTVVANTATTGGGLYVGDKSETDAEVRVVNSLFASNSATKSAQLTTKPTVRLGFNLVEGGLGAVQANILATSPLLLPQTLEISPASPGVNFGKALDLSADRADLDADGDVAEHLPVDIKGRPRSVNEPDVGAYEAQ